MLEKISLGFGRKRDNKSTVRIKEERIEDLSFDPLEYTAIAADVDKWLRSIKRKQPSMYLATGEIKLGVTGFGMQTFYLRYAGKENKKFEGSKRRSLNVTDSELEVSNTGKERIWRKLKGKLLGMGSFSLGSLKPHYLMIPGAGIGLASGLAMERILQNPSIIFPIAGAIVVAYLGGMVGEEERRFTIK